MKKTILTAAMLLLVAVATQAGGLMTNTNYHIAFNRMMARGASFDIDAAYSNPAGLAWGYDGWQLSLNFQKPWQNRDIETSIHGFLDSDFNKKYPGKASAPIVPALFAAYKHDRWALSAMIGIVGSGGFVKYDEGVPMFNVPITAMMVAQKDRMPGPFTLDSQMKGKQYIYGAQLNFTYKITEWLSAAVGVRASYYDGYYRGHVVATPGEALVPVVGSDPLVSLQLDCDQRGWGVAPILGLDFHKGPLTVAAKYEFRTRLNIPNKTNRLEASVKGMTPEQVAALFGAKMAPYKDGAKTRYDMPSLLAVAVGYEFTPKFRATAEYHFFDDRHAKMAGDRQKTLKHGTNELLLGAEYDVSDVLTLSLGGQRTDYGLSDDYQQNTSFACDSYSIGLGAAVNISKKVRLNAGYFITLYSKYNKQTPAGDPAKGLGYYGTGYGATETYSRTNNVIGIGIDYKF